MQIYYIYYIYYVYTLDIGGSTQIFYKFNVDKCFEFLKNKISIKLNESSSNLSNEFEKAKKTRDLVSVIEKFIPNQLLSQFISYMGLDKHSFFVSSYKEIEVDSIGDGSNNLEKKTKPNYFSSNQKNKTNNFTSNNSKVKSNDVKPSVKRGPLDNFIAKTKN